MINKITDDDTIRNVLKQASTKYTFPSGYQAVVVEVFSYVGRTSCFEGTLLYVPGVKLRTICKKTVEENAI